MNFTARAFLAALCLLATCAHAGNLTISVSGLQKDERRNVVAWLGKEPETEQERLNFLAYAEQRVLHGLQALGYYRPVLEIDVEDTGPVWKLAIAIDPGEPVRLGEIDIQILGPAADDPDFKHLLSASGLSKGDVLHHGTYTRFKDKLLDLGQRRGYFDARLLISRVEVQPPQGSANVSIHYDSGRRYRFGELVFENGTMDPGLLETMPGFGYGDLYEQARLRELHAVLLQTRYFSGVAIQPLRDQASDGHVPISIKLLPARRHTIDLGAGYSTDTKERLSLTWRTPKINRFGHSQVTRLEYSSVNPSGRVTYNIPLQHPLDDVLQFWARAEDNEFGDLDSRQDEVGTRRETRRGKWVYAYWLRGLNESWDIADEDAGNDYLLAGGSLSSRVHTGSVVDPRSGFNQLYTLEAGNRALGSDIDLLRFTANFRYVRTPSAGHRLVGRAELGAAEVTGGARSDLAPSLSFFAGGNQSIRGFSYNSLGNETERIRADGTSETLVTGGDRLVTASLEYQYYITEKWRGAVFIDGGDAFDAGKFDLNYGAGFGIHYLSPVGALRVELANSLSDEKPDWTLHLNIGAEF